MQEETELLFFSTGQCVAQVVDRIEAVMRLKRFSQLGGLQLERDVRLLVSVLGEATGRPVRDKFARLAQVRPRRRLGVMFNVMREDRVRFRVTTGREAGQVSRQCHGRLPAPDAAVV